MLIKTEFCVRGAMLYASECWALSKTDIVRLVKIKENMVHDGNWYNESDLPHTKYDKEQSCVKESCENPCHVLLADQ